MVFVGPSAIMKRSHFIHQIKAKLEKIGIQGDGPLMALPILAFGECGAHLQHNLYLPTFNDCQRKHELAKVSQPFPSSRPHKNIFSTVFRSLFRSALGKKTAKCIHQPFDQQFFGVGHLKIGLKVWDACLGVAAKISNIKRAFSIYNARQIGYVVGGVFFSLVNVFAYASPVLNGYDHFDRQIMSCLAATTNPDSACVSDSAGEVIVWTSGKSEEGRLKCHPRSVMLSHKSNSLSTLQNQDPVLNEMAKLLGISLRETEDVLTRDLLASTASQINCTGGTNGDNPTEMTRDDIDLVVATLVDNNAYTIASVIEGEDRFGTAPVRDAFFAMASSQLIGDFEQVNGFIAKAQYPSQMSVLREEWGSISNLRFLVSSIGSVSPTSSALGADVYNIFCVGMEAYQFIEQDGYSAQFIYRPPYFSDALAQNATVAWKAAMVPLISNDLWVINLRTTKAS